MNKKNILILMLIAPMSSYGDKDLDLTGTSKGVSNSMPNKEEKETERANMTQAEKDEERIHEELKKQTTDFSKRTRKALRARLDKEFPDSYSADWQGVRQLLKEVLNAVIGQDSLIWFTFQGHLSHNPALDFQEYARRIKDLLSPLGSNIQDTFQGDIQRLSQGKMTKRDVKAFKQSLYKALTKYEGSDKKGLMSRLHDLFRQCQFYASELETSKTLARKGSKACKDEDPGRGDSGTIPFPTVEGYVKRFKEFYPLLKQLTTEHLSGYSMEINRKY